MFNKNKRGGDVRSNCYAYVIQRLFPEIELNEEYYLDSIDEGQVPSKLE